MSRAAAALAVLVVLALPAAARADDVAVCADAAERGQELRNGHLLVEARASLVVCAGRSCPSVIRASCTEWLADVDRRVPSLVVSVRDAAGRDLPGAQVLLDGAVLPGSVLATALPANPGSHRLRYEAEGHEAKEETLVLREGEALRVLAVTLDPLPIAGPPAPERPAPAIPAARSGGVPVGPLVLAGATVVALSVFTVAGLSGAGEYRRLERECGPRCAAADIDGVRSTFLVADVALGAALVTAIGAGVWWWIDHRSSRRVEGSR